MEPIVDTSRREKVFDSTLLVYLELWKKSPKTKKPQTNSMSNAVKIWAGGVLFGPKGAVRESSLYEWKSGKKITGAMSNTF